MLNLPELTILYGTSISGWESNFDWRTLTIIVRQQVKMGIETYSLLSLHSVALRGREMSLCSRDYCVAAKNVWVTVVVGRFSASRGPVPTCADRFSRASRC
jgi:hypothetical protein